jgi:uncharacterized protein YndB with AHSA1/START domain
MSDDKQIRHEEFEAEVHVAASPETVWEAMTTGIGEWWPHSFVDHPFRVALEPTIGGRFYEQFDESGAGALFAHVIYLEPRKVLRITGPMGLRGSATYTKTYRLEASRGGTTVRTSASILGAITQETADSYRTGGQQVLDSLKRHVEGVPVTAG